MLNRIFFTFVLTLLSCPLSAQGTLTLQVGSPPPPPVPLIQPTEGWNYRKGTNAPQADWKATPALDATWNVGNGGFGYSDSPAEIALCQTTLSDMLGSYSTIYLRKNFTIGNEMDPTARLVLTMDFDDGFIAWINGAFVASSNSPASPAEPGFSAVATTTRESSLGSGGQAPTRYDLGEVGNWGAGTHTLAIMGLNQSRSSSSDFVLVPKLELVPQNAEAINGGKFLAVVKTNTVVLSGTNTLNGSTRVSINGDDASFSSTDGKWSREQPLRSGVNKIFVGGLDSSGNVLGSSNYMVVAELKRREVSGLLELNTTWSAADGVVYLNGSVVVPPGGTLNIEPGSVVMISAGALIAGTNATVHAAGTTSNPVYFLPADGTTAWGGFEISGTNGVLTLQHVETVAGRIELLDGATGTLEDSFFHDHVTTGPPILHTEGVPNPVRLKMTRCHLANYYEVLCQASLNEIENCLFEYNVAGGDGIDFDGALPGSYIRNCTLRHGKFTNIDGLDMGEYGSTGTKAVIDSCLIYDFVDKGVSMGVAVEVTVTNTLIYQVDSGIAVKDNSRASLYNNTIAKVNYGYNNYNKGNAAALEGGGHIVSSRNNIIWNTTNAAFTLRNGSTLVAEYTDFQGTNFPGAGNISADPLFVDVAKNDFRVMPNSPTLGSGFGGANMGVTLPVGGIPGQPLNLSANGNGVGPVGLNWEDNAENETGYAIERSADGQTWSPIGTAVTGATTFSDAAALLNVRSYYRVKAVNSFGESSYSNTAGAERVSPQSYVGGAISVDQRWASGVDVVVTNTVTIGAGATLTIDPGVKVYFSSGQGMVVASGGRLLAEGTESAPISFTRSDRLGYWGNLRINGASGSPETRIAYAHFDYNANSTSTAAIDVVGGTVFFDHLTFGNTDAPYIELEAASFIIQNCVFPTTTSGFEPVHGVQGIKAGGHAIFTRNFFGNTIGYSDVVDFTGGNRPGPIVHFIDNVFSGATDDHLDLDGADAWVEGNIFLHVHRNGSPDSASAVSGGRSGTQLSEITILGNIFYDADQAAMAKEGNFYTLINNTAVRITHEGGEELESGVVALSDEGTPEGLGMYLEANIVLDAEQLVRDRTNAVVTWNKNILPLAWNGPGSGNLVADPLLKKVPTISETIFTDWASAQVMWDWFSLQAGSPGIGTGPDGGDQGWVPIGIAINGEPNGATTSRNVTLHLGPWRSGNEVPVTAFPQGSGYTHYKWRLNGGAWSEEVPAATPITLDALADGEYFVEAVGRRDSGLWQDDPRFGPAAVISRSQTWRVQTQLPAPQLSVELTDAGEIVLRFQAEAGTTYGVEYTAVLGNGSWTHLKEVTASANPVEVEVTDGMSGGSARFYRVVAGGRQ